MSAGKQKITKITVIRGAVISDNNQIVQMLLHQKILEQ